MFDLFVWTSLTMKMSSNDIIANHIIFVFLVVFCLYLKFFLSLDSSS